MTNKKKYDIDEVRIRIDEIFDAIQFRIDSKIKEITDLYNMDNNSDIPKSVVSLISLLFSFVIDNSISRCYSDTMEELDREVNNEK